MGIESVRVHAHLPVPALVPALVPAPAPEPEPGPGPGPALEPALEPAPAVQPVVPGTAAPLRARTQQAVHSPRPSGKSTPPQTRPPRAHVTPSAATRAARGGVPRRNPGQRHA